MEINLKHYQQLCEDAHYLITRPNYAPPYMELAQNEVKLKVSSDFYHKEDKTIEIYSGGDYKEIEVEDDFYTASCLIASLVVTFELEDSFKQLVANWRTYDERRDYLLEHGNYEEEQNLKQPDNRVIIDNLYF